MTPMTTKQLEALRKAREAKAKKNEVDSEATQLRLAERLEKNIGKTSWYKVYSKQISKRNLEYWNKAASFICQNKLVECLMKNAETEPCYNNNILTEIESIRTTFWKEACSGLRQDEILELAREMIKEDTDKNKTELIVYSI